MREVCMYQKQPTRLVQFYSFKICIKVFLYNDTLPSLYHEINISKANCIQVTRQSDWRRPGVISMQLAATVAIIGPIITIIFINNS